MQRRRPPEHHQIDQGIAAQAVGAMHRGAGRLAHRHQPRHHRIGIAIPRAHHLGAPVGGNAAHVVVAGGHHRDRFLGDVDPGEDTGGLGDARQPLVDQFRRQMFQVQQHMVLVGAAAAPLHDLHHDGAAHHIPRGQILGLGGVTLHEALTF